MTRKEGRARPLTITEGLVTGAIAGVMNNACTIPFDVVATNHQISGLDRNKKNGGKGNTHKKESTIQGLVSTAREVYAKGGVPAFWAGLGPSCLLVVNPAINFAAFDRLKLLYNRSFKGGKGRKLTANEAANMSLGPLEAFFIGAASKAIATSITFPLIRAKVLMMSADKENAKKGKKDNNKKDDGRIVIDEVVGQLLTLAPLAVVPGLWPRSAGWLLTWHVTGFVVFRVLDIWKPGPIRRMEQRFAGGAGVMMDDVLAGLIGAVPLALAAWIVPALVEQSR